MDAIIGFFKRLLGKGDSESDGGYIIPLDDEQPTRHERLNDLIGSLNANQPDGFVKFNREQPTLEDELTTLSQGLDDILGD